MIPDTLTKNRSWREEGKTERTCFFWVERDAPEAVKEALRLLTYTGIVNKLDSGVIATRREIGTRYALSIGCLAASEANPITYISDLRGVFLLSVSQSMARTLSLSSILQPTLALSSRPTYRSSLRHSFKSRLMCLRCLTTKSPR